MDNETSATEIGNIAAKVVGEHQLQLAQYIDDNMLGGIGKTRLLTQLAALTIEIGQHFQLNGVRDYPLTPEGQALMERANAEIDEEIRNGREG